MIAASFDEEDGEMRLPTTISRAAMAWYQAANAGVSSYTLLTIAAANLLKEHGSVQQAAAYLPDLLGGAVFATMCLSEPEAGSSLADVTTPAIRDGEGVYRVVGTKMWISGGDHEMGRNIVHFVLAKVPGGPPGVKGISLFLVPKYLPDGSRNDVSVVGLNHKMGNRATVNAVLAFGEGTRSAGCPGAIGYLVGKEHRGLHYMFHMMNEARLGVGMLATAIGYSAYLRALALGLFCARLSDVICSPFDKDEGDHAALLLDILTPIAKTWPAHWCSAANDLAI
jgi:alkylation response protein AidB-like acyl-CoA dehydrogenase